MNCSRSSSLFAALNAARSSSVMMYATSSFSHFLYGVASSSRAFFSFALRCFSVIGRALVSLCEGGGLCCWLVVGLVCCCGVCCGPASDNPSRMETEMQTMERRVAFIRLIAHCTDQIRLTTYSRSD